MSLDTTKQSWFKTIFQRISVIFGPKRLSLEPGTQSLTVETIVIPDEFSFETITNIYNTYTLDYNKNIINKENNEISDDIALSKKYEFSNLWRKCASGNLTDEPDEIALSICFNEEAKETYNQISKYAIIHLLKYGHIDTKEILDVTKEMPYRWSRQTARKLFKNVSQAKLVTNYYRLATPNAKPQTANTLTTDEALYGLEN